MNSPFKTNISKQQIFKSNKPAKIVFEARWLSDDNKPLSNFIQYFKKKMLMKLLKGLLSKKKHPENMSWISPAFAPRGSGQKQTPFKIRREFVVGMGEG
jgi:hypothetical protein